MLSNCQRSKCRRLAAVYRSRHSGECRYRSGPILRPRAICRGETAYLNAFARRRGESTPAAALGECLLLSAPRAGIAASYRLYSGLSRGWVNFFSPQRYGGHGGGERLMTNDECLMNDEA